MRRLLAAAALAGVVCLAGCTTSTGLSGAVPLPPSQTVAPAVSPQHEITAHPHPSEVSIPRLGVVDEVVPVGLDVEGAMVVPPVDRVGWYERGPAPGEVGPAVLAGHVNYDGVIGSFSRIGELQPGDRIEVTDTAGTGHRFTVYDVMQVDKDVFPTGLVWGDTETPELRLITCSGAVINHDYTENTIVRARLAT